MKGKITLSVILGLGTLSLSHLASAGWDPGPCPQPHTGPAPCFEVVIDDDYYHFNGDGSHADIWHGHPIAGDLSFSGPTELDCDSLGIDCTLTLNGQVKKCLDSNGDWRIGVKVNSSSISGGGLCGVIGLGNFPWFVGNTDLPHCPFEDDCDNFIPYTPNPTSLVGNVGSINISILGLPRVTAGHLHGVVFTPGCPASFAFSSEFYDCDENPLGCSVVGTLLSSNVDCLNVY